MAEEHSMEQRPGSSGPNDLLDVTKKAPYEAPVPASDEFKPVEVTQNYDYVAGDGSGNGDKGKK